MSVASDGANSGWLETGRATGNPDGAGARVFFRAPRRDGACDVTASYQSNLLRVYNADIHVPDGATVRGARVRVRARVEGEPSQLRTMHFWGPAYQEPRISSSKASNLVPLTNPWETHFVGTQVDRWGLGDDFNAAYVNNEGFGLRLGFDTSLTCNASDSEVQVDSAAVNIYYEVCH